MSRVFSSVVNLVVLSLLSAVVALSLLPWLLPSERWRRFVYADEAGLFEQVSVWLWLVLAAALLLAVRPMTWRVLAGSVVCLAAAAREADWHKALTSESVLKFSYYLDADEPMLQRLAIGAVVLGCVACLVAVVLTVARHVRAQWHDRPAWMGLLLVFVIVGVVSKLLDRLPAIMAEEFGVSLPAMAQQMMLACEEGLEMLLPVVLAVAVIGFAYARATMDDTPRPQPQPQ